MSFIFTNMLCPDIFHVTEYVETDFSSLDDVSKIFLPSHESVRDIQNYLAFENKDIVTLSLKGDTVSGNKVGFTDHKGQWHRLVDGFKTGGAFRFFVESDRVVRDPFPDPSPYPTHLYGIPLAGVDVEDNPTPQNLPEA